MRSLRRRRERTSKGAERVFAVRRKQSEADFARTKRQRRIRFSPTFCVTGITPSVTFGDSSLGEESKDEGCGFDRLRPQNDVDGGAWFFFVRGAASQTRP